MTKHDSYVRKVFFEFLSVMLFFLLTSSLLLSMEYTFPGFESNIHIFLAAAYISATFVAVYSAFSRISEIHMNPCVTIVLFSCGQQSLLTTLGYLISQVFGAVSGCLYASLLFLGTSETLLELIRHLLVYQTSEDLSMIIIGESTASFLLVFVFLALFLERFDFDNRNYTSKILDLEGHTLEEHPLKDLERQPTELLKRVMDTPSYEKMNIIENGVNLYPRDIRRLLHSFIYGIFMWMVLIIGQYSSGPIFNPLRLLGPGIILWKFDNFLVYFASELIGAILGGLFYFLFYFKGAYFTDKKAQVNYDTVINTKPKKTTSDSRTKSQTTGDPIKVLVSDTPKTTNPNDIDDNDATNLIVNDSVTSPVDDVTKNSLAAATQ